MINATIRFTRHSLCLAPCTDVLHVLMHIKWAMSRAARAQDYIEFIELYPWDAESIADAESVAEDESVADAVANVAADEILLVCFFCNNIAHHT